MDETPTTDQTPTTQVYASEKDLEAVEAERREERARRRAAAQAVLDLYAGTDLFRGRSQEELEGIWRDHGCDEPHVGFAGSVRSMLEDQGVPLARWFQDDLYYTAAGLEAAQQRRAVALLLEARPTILDAVAARLAQAPAGTRVLGALLDEVQVAQVGLLWDAPTIRDWVAEDPRFAEGTSSFGREVLRLVDPEDQPRDRKVSMNITARTDAEIQDLIRDGYAADQTSVVRGAVHDSWMRMRDRQRYE